MCGGVIMSELYRVASALCHMEATIQDEKGLNNYLSCHNMKTAA